MTELEKNVDREVGNDAEQARVTYLKYVNYGKQLASENLIANEVVIKMIGDAVQANTELIFQDIDALESQVSEQQAIIETEDEDNALQSLKNRVDLTDPKMATLFSDFLKILDSVDKKHTAIIRDIRIPGLLAIKAKYID